MSKGIEFLNSRLKNNEDYELINLPERVKTQLDLECGNIESNNEEFIYDKVEELLHVAIIKLGYNQDQQDYKWKLT